MVLKIWRVMMHSGNYYQLWMSRLSDESVHSKTRHVAPCAGGLLLSFQPGCCSWTLQREILKLQLGGKLLERWIPTAAVVWYKRLERERCWRLLPDFWQEWTNAINYWELTLCHSLCRSLIIQSGWNMDLVLKEHIIYLIQTFSSYSSTVYKDIVNNY